MIMNNMSDDEIFRKRFGNRIRQLRKARNFTQEQFAEFIDIDTQHLCKTENGMHFPSLKNLLKLAQGLEVEPVDLFAFDIEENDEIMNRIIYNVKNKLDFKELKFVDNFIISLIKMLGRHIC